MIAKIIPLKRLPSNLSYFDYLVPSTLESTIAVGQCVRIPLRNQKIQGVVFELDAISTHGKLKSIIDIIPRQHLSTDDIDLMRWMACEYVVSAAVIARMMLAPTPSRSRELKMSVSQKMPALPKISASPHVIDELKFVYEKLLEKKHVLYRWDCADDRIFLYAKCIDAALKKGEQCLIICPTLAEMRLLRARLRSYIDTAIDLLDCDVTLAHQREIQNRVREGATQVLFGTRRASMLSFARLGLIIIDHAESPDHKNYDQHPRYDAREVALYRSQKHNILLLSASSAPRLEDLFLTQNASLTYCESLLEQNADIVNLSNERRSGLPAFISETLIECVRESLSQNKHAILFFNRKGSSRMVVCKECEYTFSCHACKGVQTYFSKDGTLFCGHCQTKDALPSQCPLCRSADYQFIGIGIEKLSKTLQEHLSTPIIEVTRESLPQSIPSPSVIIGTSALPIHFPEIFAHAGCIALVSADPFYSTHDFRALEYQWQMFADILSRAPKEARKIIQSYEPTHFFVQTLYRNDYPVFAAEILAQRNKFAWPPESRLIRILLKSVQETDIITHMQRECETLFSSNFLSLESHDNHSITFKLSIRYGKDFPDEFSRALHSLPQGCLIDKDPIF